MSLWLFVEQMMERINEPSKPLDTSLLPFFTEENSVLTLHKARAYLLPGDRGVGCGQQERTALHN